MTKEAVRDGILKMAQAKYTQAQAKYRDADDPDKACGNCSHYTEEDASRGDCKEVEGEVEAFKVCDRWNSDKAEVTDTDRDI